jgi:hypothetical protein
MLAANQLAANPANLLTKSMAALKIDLTNTFL